MSANLLQPLVLYFCDKVCNCGWEKTMKNAAVIRPAEKSMKPESIN